MAIKIYLKKKNTALTKYQEILKLLWGYLFKDASAISLQHPDDGRSNSKT